MNPGREKIHRPGMVKGLGGRRGRGSVTHAHKAASAWSEKASGIRRLWWVVFILPHPFPSTPPSPFKPSYLQRPTPPYPSPSYTCFFTPPPPTHTLLTGTTKKPAANPTFGWHLLGQPTLALFLAAAIHSCHFSGGGHGDLTPNQMSS